MSARDRPSRYEPGTRLFEAVRDQAIPNYGPREFYGWFSLLLRTRGTGPRATGRGPGYLVSIPLLLINNAEEGFADQGSFKVITEKSHRPV